MLCSEIEYLCNGCRTPGVGSWHSSQSRSVNLHDYCASCPATLSSFMHPHPLTLTEQDPQAQCLNQRQCSLCHDYVLGLFYTCKDCNFHVHPICTQLPELLFHVVDPFHFLRLLQPSPIPACCAVCACPCTSWHYGCVACGLHIHLDSVLTPFALPTPYSSFPPQPPLYGAFTNYGYGCRPCGSGHGVTPAYPVSNNQPPLGSGHGVAPAPFALPNPYSSFPPQPQPPPYGAFANYGYGCPPYGCGHGVTSGYPVSNNQPPLGSGHGVTSAYPVSNNQPPLGSGHGCAVPPRHDHSYAHHGNANHDKPQAQAPAQSQAQDHAQVSGSTIGRIRRVCLLL